MHDIKAIQYLRQFFLNLRVRIYNKLWKMNIDPSSRFSLTAKLDKTYPKGIHIGPQSYVAFGASILTHDMTRGLYLDTRIGRRCFIGAHSIILPGVTIGDESIVAAGSVVTKDVPPNTIVAGNPARVIRENIEVVAYGRLKEADANEARCLSMNQSNKEKKTMTLKSAAAIALILIMPLTLAACTLPGGATMQAPATLDKQITSALQPGDKLKITVYGEETLTGEYMIDSQGIVSVPLVGAVAAAGETKETIETQIIDILIKDKLLSEPHVTVEVVEARPVSILGEVKKPGSIEFVPGMTSFDAIAAAEGYTPRAARNMILIDRNLNGARTKMNANEATPLLPGDAVTVRERLF